MTKNLLITTLLVFTFIHLSFGEEYKVDYGERVHVFGRPATGNCFPVKLGDSGFTANYMVCHYTDKTDDKPDFVTISVEKSEGNRSTEIFEREFPAKEISDWLLKAKSKDIISYNNIRKIVYFDLDGKVLRYALPNH